jgi:hypothetical protein
MSCCSATPPLPHHASTFRHGLYYVVGSSDRGNGPGLGLGHPTGQEVGHRTVDDAPFHVQQHHPANAHVQEAKRHGPSVPPTYRAVRLYRLYVYKIVSRRSESSSGNVILHSSLHQMNFVTVRESSNMPGLTTHCEHWLPSLWVGPEFE